MALSPDKSSKLFRALSQVIDAHLELDRVRAEVYAPSRRPQPAAKQGRRRQAEHAG